MATAHAERWRVWRIMATSTIRYGGNLRTETEERQHLNRTGSIMWWGAGDNRQRRGSRHSNVGLDAYIVGNDRSEWTGQMRYYTSSGWIMQMYQNIRYSCWLIRCRHSTLTAVGFRAQASKYSVKYLSWDRAPTLPQKFHSPLSFKGRHTQPLQNGS